MKSSLIHAQRHLLAVFSLSLLFLFHLNDLNAGVIRKGSTRTATSSNNYITLRKPAGVVAGDVMIVNLAYYGTQPATLNGWTSLSQQSLGTGKWGAVLYRIAQTGEPKTYTFNLGTGAYNAVGAMVAFGGVKIVNGNPFDGIPGSINIGATSVATANAITTTSNGSAVIMLTQEVGSGRSWSSWSTANLGSLTEIADVRNIGDASVGIAWKIATAAGNTGNGTATLSAAQHNGAVLLALKPGSVNYFVRLDVPNAAQNLHLISSWTDSESGVGGNSPTNFSNDEQVFNIGFTVTGAHAIGANWMVTGADSKIILGDGETASTLTITEPYVINGTIDVEPEATLNIATTGNLDGLHFGLLEPYSRVSYTATSGTQIVKSATYYHLTLTGNGLKNAAGDITVNGELYLGDNPSAERGQLEMTKSYLYYADVNNTNSTSVYNNLDAYILTMGPDAVTSGTGDVTGKILRTYIASGVTYTFGNANTQLTFNNTGGGTLPTRIMVVATIGTQGLHVDKTNAVKRLYQVLRTGGTNPTRMIIRLAYLDGELNYNTESKLVLWDHHLPYGGITPHEHGKTNQNVSANWVELSNHYVEYLATEGNTNFTKYWMISDKISTAITWLGAISNAWDNPSNWSTGIVPQSTDAVVIPDASTTPRDPVLEGNITVGAIEIQPGGVLNGGSAVLTLTKGPAYNGGSGTWVNNGVFDAGTSTVIINYDSATIAGNTAFYNLTINAQKRLVIQDEATLEIKGSLVNNGVIDATYGKSTFIYSGSNQNIVAPNGEIPGYHHLIITGSNAILPPTLYITGNLQIDGSIDAATNNTHVHMKYAPHAVCQSISGVQAITFSHLTIDNPLGVSVNGVDITVNESLTLQDGKLMLPNVKLTLNGALIRDSGTIDATTGTIAFKGASLQQIPDNVFAGAVYRLEVEKSNQPLWLSSNVEVQQLSLAAGTIELKERTLGILGNIERQNGTLDAAAGEVAMQGNNTQQLPSGLFNNQVQVLTIDNPAGIYLQTSVTVNELVLQEGMLHLNNETLTTNLITGGNAAAYVKISGNGKLRSQISNGASITYPVGTTSFTPVTITNQSGVADTFEVGLLEEVYDKGTTGDPLALTAARVKRTWMIHKANPNNGAGVNFLFQWNPEDVHGILVNPRLFHYDAATEKWVKQTGSFSQPTANSLAYSGYTGSFSPFSIIDDLYVLPLTWLSFQAQRENTAALLTWTTTHEYNCKDFVIQYSVNGSQWQTIGVVSAAGVYGSTNRYQFRHTSPAQGNNYYRLMQRDLDGAFNYSSVVKLNFDNVPPIKVLGNPVSNGMLVLQLAREGTLAIYSSDGKQMLQSRFAAGTHRIDVMHYAKGIYYLHFGDSRIPLVVQ